MIFNLFKIRYDWYEGEYEESILCKDIEKKEFEKDLIEAKEFAKGLIGKEIKDEGYLGKGYSVECLPEYYKQIIWFMTEKKGYTECYNNEDESYRIEDSDNGKNILIEKNKEKTEISKLE